MCIGLPDRPTETTVRAEARRPMLDAVLACTVAEDLAQADERLARHRQGWLTPFDRASPPMRETFAFATSELITDRKPDGS